MIIFLMALLVIIVVFALLTFAYYGVDKIAICGKYLKKGKRVCKENENDRKEDS
jgi:uncharacterized membrane protein YsdA (DUF1294 family)